MPFEAIYGGKSTYFLVVRMSPSKFHDNYYYFPHILTIQLVSFVLKLLPASWDLIAFCTLHSYHHQKWWTRVPYHSNAQINIWPMSGACSWPLCHFWYVNPYVRGVAAVVVGRGLTSLHFILSPPYNVYCRKGIRIEPYKCFQASS